MEKSLRLKSDGLCPSGWPRTRPLPAAIDRSEVGVSSCPPIDERPLSGAKLSGGSRLRQPHPLWSLNRKSSPKHAMLRARRPKRIFRRFAVRQSMTYRGFCSIRESPQPNANGSVG